MEDELIFNNFQKHISLCHLEKQKLKSALLERQMGRKEIALHQGQICRKIYFVQSGSLRAFHINEDGKESTIMFAVCDWWITDMNCFANQKSAMLTIESRRLYKRETEEETGYQITLVQKIFEAYISPGSVTEIVQFFYCGIYSVYENKWMRRNH